ncbi:MAG: hypothetical protein ABFS37_01190 [Acidobacteriota bacterium]
MRSTDAVAVPVPDAVLGDGRGPGRCFLPLSLIPNPGLRERRHY